MTINLFIFKLLNTRSVAKNGFVAGTRSLAHLMEKLIVVSRPERERLNPEPDAIFAILFKSKI